MRMKYTMVSLVLYFPLMNYIDLRTIRRKKTAPQTSQMLNNCLAQCPTFKRGGLHFVADCNRGPHLKSAITALLKPCFGCEVN